MPTLTSSPTVAVVIVNLNGAEHLTACLTSLAELRYPREKLEVVVVDNGSTDGSLDLLATQFPEVRVLPQGTNTGFAPAVNIGARATSAQCVALLNNDMRVDPGWLEALTAAFDPANGVVCVGGQIVSWDGERLDFGDGSLNYYGMGRQPGYNRDLEEAFVTDGHDLLFACGGSMLVDREIYLATGGLDDRFFAYFEDVDFGWRLWVLGYRVRFAAGAKTYHRMHGTSSRFPEHQTVLLYERNALQAILKNYDDRNLERLLGPALLLLIKRSLCRAHLDRSAYDFGGDTAPTEEVARVVLGPFHAVADVIDSLPQIMAERDRIQQARRRRDDDIIRLFGRPLEPMPKTPDFLTAQHNVTKAFGLDRLFDRAQATRVVVVSTDEVGEKMRGPAVRAWEIACALAPTVDVTIAVPAPSPKSTPDGVSFAVYEDENDLLRHASVADVVVLQGYALQRAPRLARLDALFVVDLYDPWLFENLEVTSTFADGDRYLRTDATVLNDLLDLGDFFVCASERQRDYWLGMLSARGRLDQAAYQFDRTLRGLIDVVPFGLPARSPEHRRPVLKGVHPAIAEDDLVVLWGGGTWDWFDPVLVIDAFADVVAQVPNARLYFLGRQLASDDVAPMRMADAAVVRAEALGLAGRSVIFGDWAEYDLRESYLLEADVAVSAARDLAETRLAFRSRVLDCFWAGLPVVTTDGDVLADLVRDQAAGAVVPSGDAKAFADALIGLLRDPHRREQMAENARRLAGQFEWREAVGPLRNVVTEPWRWRAVRRRRPHERLTEDTQLLLVERDRQIDELKGQLDEAEVRRQGDVAALQRHIDGLEELVAIQEARLARLRRVPVVYPVFRVIKRVFRRGQ